MRAAHMCVALVMIWGVACACASEQSEVVWHAAEEIASGKGEKGPWRQNDSRYDYVDDPAIALDYQGNAAIAWVDQKRKDVLFRRFGAEAKHSPTQAINISRNPETFSWLPRIAYAPEDPRRIYVIWQEIIFSGAFHGGEIFFARSNDGGQSFEKPINVSHSFGGDGKGRINRDIWHNGSYDLAVDRCGKIHLVWTEYDGMLWIAQSSNRGKSFSTPRHLAGSRERPARGPSIAIGKENAVFLAWTTGENDAADILLASSTDSGATFGKPQAIAPSKTYSDAPKLAVDGKGHVHLAYAESDGGPFGNYQVRYTRSTDGARSFEPPRVVSFPLPQNATGAAFPALAVEAGDTVVLTWEIFRHKDGRPRGLGISVSRDGGQTFSRPSVVPGSMDPTGGGNGSQQGLLMEKLAVDNRGTIAVVNSSLKPGSRSRVWLMRGQLQK